MRAAWRPLLSAAAVFTLVVSGLVATLSLAASGRARSGWNERGVELGMSEEQVRQSFLDAAAGDWTRGTACGGPSLEWRRREPGVSTRWARFELHDGWLVAMRFHTDAPSGGARASQTWSAVRQERPFEGGTATTVIARGCASHASEAAQIALAATSSWLAER